MQRVELFGVPRLLTGQRVVEVAGENLAEVTAALAAAFPSLVGPVVDPGTGWLVSGYQYAVDEQFTREPTHAVGRSLILVASAAGG